MNVRSSSGGADRARLAEWERWAFTALRRHAELVTVVDDELPELPYTEDGSWRFLRAM